MLEAFLTKFYVQVMLLLPCTYNLLPLLKGAYGFIMFSIISEEATLGHCDNFHDVIKFF